MKRRVALGLWAAATLAGCGSNSDATAAAPAALAEIDRSAPTSAAHGWAPVRSAADATVLRALGRVVGVGASAGAEIALPFVSHVRAMYVAPGDRVETGAPLAEVLAPELALAVAEVRGARGELEVFEERLGAVQSLQKEGLVRADEVHEVEHAIAGVRARLGVAEARLRSAGITARQRRDLATRGAMVVTSPIDGVVRSVGARLGSAVASSAPLLDIAATSGRTRVEVQLPHSFPSGRAMLVRDGNATIELEPLGGAVREPETGLWVAWYEPVGDQAELLAGERWPVRWAGGDARNAADAVEVPARALDAAGAEARVHRRRGEGLDAAVETVAVDVLRVDGARALVRPRTPGALRAGDVVTTDPARVLGEEPTL